MILKFEESDGHPGRQCDRTNHIVDMIREYVNNPSGTPVELTCDKKCYVLEGSLWKEQLSAMQDSIVFIDEGNEFIKTVEFADTIQKNR